MGTFHSAVLPLYTMWRHQFPIQENLCVQRLTLSSVAYGNANKTRSINKILNFNEHSTSSDLILLIRSMFCYWEAFVANTMPVTPLALESMGVIVNICDAACPWESLCKKT